MELKETQRESHILWLTQYSLVQCVLGGLVQGTGDQDSDDQTVNGNDTRHDDRNDGLHDQLRPHHRHGGDTGSGLGGTIGGSKSCSGGGIKQRNN